MTRTALLVAAALVAMSSTARADAIGPPPKSCPPGSVGSSSHCGPECVLVPCKSDKDCHNKTVCRTTRLCVVKGERSPCGRVPGNMRHKKYPFSNAQGRCPDKGKCARGACVEAKRCVKPSEASTPKTAPEPKPKAAPEPKSTPGPKPAPVESAPTKPPKKKGCQVGGTSGGASAAALALLLLLRRRRR